MSAGHGLRGGREGGGRTRRSRSGGGCPFPAPAPGCERALGAGAGREGARGVSRRPSARRGRWRRGGIPVGSMGGSRGEQGGMDGGVPVAERSGEGGGMEGESGGARGAAVAGSRWRSGAGGDGAGTRWRSGAGREQGWRWCWTERVRPLSDMEIAAGMGTKLLAGLRLANPAAGPVPRPRAPCRWQGDDFGTAEREEGEALILRFAVEMFVFSA